MRASTDFTSSGFAAGTPTKGSGGGCWDGGFVVCWAGALSEEDWAAAKDEMARAAVNASSASFMS